MNKYAAYAVVLALALGVGYLVFYGDAMQRAGEAQAGMETIREDSESFTVGASYPQTGITAIDADIEATVRAAVEQFKTYPANPVDSSVPQNEFLGTFDSVYIGPDVVSAELVFSEYTGGAHPNAAIVGLNYDAATAKKLTLDDALGMIGLSLEQVAAEADAKFKAELAEAYFPEGAEPAAENYSVFIVDADSVTFIFQNYQVGPYAAGPQEISFSRAK